MDVVNDHREVLQNIETILASFYRNNPTLTDFEATRVYEALIDAYAAETSGRQPRNWRLEEMEKALFASLKSSCDKFLRRVEDQGEVKTEEPAVDIPILIACLKRLVKSAQTWSKRHGKRGYLDYINNFIP